VLVSSRPLRHTEEADPGDKLQLRGGGSPVHSSDHPFCQFLGFTGSSFLVKKGVPVLKPGHETKDPMMTPYVSKKSRLLTALRNRQALTVRQIKTKFNYTSLNSVYATISHLRKEGYQIVASEAKNGATKYALA
jgi:hypothetical protein